MYDSQTRNQNFTEAVDNEPLAGTDKKNLFEVDDQWVHAIRLKVGNTIYYRYEDKKKVAGESRRDVSAIK
jgi:hypothetical protein